MFDGVFQLFEEKKRCLAVGFCGAGGKTTSLYALADALIKIQQNVLITTTTKMFPSENSDKIKIVIRETISENDLSPKVVTQWFCRIDDEGKGRAPQINEIEKANKYANIWKLIEIDGAKRLPLKAPRLGEPVLCEGLDLVYGVLGASAFGKPISGQLIHRLDEFLAVTSAKPGDQISPEVLARLIASPMGLFRDIPSSVERRVLIGQAGPEQEAFIRSLAALIDLPVEVMPWTAS